MDCLPKVRNLLRSIGITLLKDAKNISFAPWIWIPILLQVVLFAPSIFLMNDVGFSFLSSVGVDHASMLDSMLKILEPTNLYDQTAGYHSSYYGWTYFCFSFWFLLPVKVIVWLVGVPAFLPVYIGLKILHFAYGLLATVSFFFLSKKFLNNPFAVIATLVFVSGSALFRYNYMFHPEPVGVFFLNLAMIYLYDFHVSTVLERRARMTQYFIILLFLVLSTLAKPTFFPVTAPLFLILLAVYKNKDGASFKSFFLGGDFKKVILSTTLFSLATFFAVNPYFFIKLRKVLVRQQELMTFQSQSALALPTGVESGKAWIHLLGFQPFVVFSIFSVASIAIYLVFSKKPDAFTRRAIIFLQIFVLANIAFTMFFYRTFIMVEYLIPIAPILVLSAMVTLYSTSSFLKLQKRSSCAATLAVVVALLFSSVKSNVSMLEVFYDYRDRPQYKVYSYIQNMVPDNSSIAHDHIAPIPDGKGIKDYHYWQYAPETIVSAHPDYIIFDTSNKFNGHYQDQMLSLMHMTETEPYKKVTTIKGGASQIEIWKREGLAPVPGGF